jgi:hypothetical protein
MAFFCFTQVCAITLHAHRRQFAPQAPYDTRFYCCCCCCCCCHTPRRSGQLPCMHTLPLRHLTIGGFTAAAAAATPQAGLGNFPACTPCPSGTFNRGDARMCTPCGYGLVSLPGATGPEFCQVSLQLATSRHDSTL